MSTVIHKTGSVGWSNPGAIVAYLEISPRQTGKTGRLYELARRVISERKKVCYVVASEGSKKDAQLAIPAALVLADGEPFPHNLNPTEYTWFYDEFEWIKSVGIKQGGYYATSPRYMRTLGEEDPTDILPQLIKAAGGRFERFTWPFGMGDMLQEARHLYTPEEFRRLCLGEFLQ